MRIATLHASRAGLERGRWLDIYQAAFSAPPYNETLPDFFNFAARLGTHLKAPGFLAACAWPAPDQPAVGFAYGLHSAPDGWLANLAGEVLDLAQQAAFLSDCFELAELAVLPEWQGQGLGAALHDALLAARPERSACLLTADLETRALRLYRRRGWLCLAGGIELPGTRVPFQLMGKMLNA